MVRKTLAGIGVVALLAATALGVGAAGAATGASFLLGKVNRAPSTSALIAKAGSPLRLSGSKTDPPLRVNSTVEVRRLNAAMVGGVGLAGLQRPIESACATGIQSATASGVATCSMLQDVITTSTTWTVPTGATEIDVTAVGAGGGGTVGGKGRIASGGSAGASLTAALSVTPGERLDVVIGKPGAAASGSGSASAGTATVVYRESGSGAMLLRAAGGNAGAAASKRKACPASPGGEPTVAGGAVGLAAAVGSTGTCAAGGGAAGFPGAGGAPGEHGRPAASGRPGVVVLTIVG